MPRTRISVDSEEPDKTATLEPSAPVPKEPPVGEPSNPDLPPGRDPRFPEESTTDEELRAVSGKTPMSMFVAFPKNIHFAGELPGEDIVLILRAHLITNVPWLLMAFLASLVPLILAPVGTATGFLPSDYFGTAFFLTIFWYMGIFSYGLLQILYWYFNVGIITNERIVDVDWLTLTSHDIANTRISKLEDVKSVRNGVLAGPFDYGTVFAQTAGTENNVEFINIPHPDLVVRKMQELMQVQEAESDN